MEEEGSPSADASNHLAIEVPVVPAVDRVCVALVPKKLGKVGKYQSGRGAGAQVSQRISLKIRARGGRAWRIQGV